jgi:hypothetical protein
MVSQLVLDRAAYEEQARLQRITEAWSAYYGHLPPPLKVKPGQVDDNVMLNFAAVIVDKGVSFLFGEDLDFEAMDDTGDQSLEACWDANKRMSLLQDMALNGAVCGHVFVKIIADGVIGLDGQRYPRLVNLDPATVFPVWDPDDYTHVLSYRIQWNAIDPDTGKPLTRRQRIVEDGAVWQIIDEVCRGDSRVWEQLSAATWPYPWPPLVDCQNLPAPNEFWGRSDLEEDVIAVNKAINFVMTNTARILRFHAHPKTWGCGFKADDLRIGVDETIILPNQNASLQNLEMTSDLGSSLELYKRLKEALHEISQVPEVATGKMDGVGALSGVALDILYQSLVEKTKKKRRRYGDMLTVLNGRLLEMMGRPVTRAVQIHWPNILPVNSNEEAQTGLLYEQLGVSRETILTRLGFDAELETEKRSEEAQQRAELGQNLLASFDQGGQDGGGQSGSTEPAPGS